MTTVSCYSEDPPKLPYSMDIPNGCLIKSIVAEDVLNTYDGKICESAKKYLNSHGNHDARVMILSGDRGCDHAVCVYNYNGSKFVYDPNYGSYSLGLPDTETRAPVIFVAVSRRMREEYNSGVWEEDSVYAIGADKSITIHE